MSKNKLIAIIVSVALGIFVSTSQVNAGEDMRALQMRAYLTKVKSPMVGLEEYLINSAEKYDLDWTLLAAIAGTESTFGKRMPYQCINPYGWGIYGTKKLCYDSYEAAIDAVAKGLGTKYNTTSLETIAKTYNKVSTEGWTKHTRFFMNKIKNQTVAVKSLPIEL